MIALTGVARAAGAAAMAHYGRAASVAKADSSPVTDADYASNAVLVDGIRRLCPGDAILSEESQDSPDRLVARRVWIVDPLDGTREFLAQNGEFSVMLGLVEDGEPVVGIVYLPAGDVLYSAWSGGGAWVERGDRRVALQREAMDGGSLRLVGSRSHADPLLTRMQAALGITDVLPCGSVGVKCGRIAEGSRDVYLHPVPYLKEWDTCAPEAILRAAGGEITDCRGDRLRYNKANPTQPHGIVACAPGALERVLMAIVPIYEASRAEGVGA